jgi:hypothetical protein
MLSTLWSSRLRAWLIVASLLCLPLLIYPPWHDGYQVEGPAWLFSPPYRGAIDSPRLVVELGCACLTALLLVLCFPTWQRSKLREVLGSPKAIKILLAAAGALLLLSLRRPAILVGKTSCGDEPRSASARNTLTELGWWPFGWIVKLNSCIMRPQSSSLS